MSEIFNFERSPVEELRDLLPGTDGFDLGTRPHGLSVDLPEPHQETPGASSLSLHAKPVLTLPEAYTSPKVRSDCRCIREAAAKQAREGAHYLRLDDREYLHVYAAVEHDRNRTRKAIRKGVADPQDLKATDSLWGILQAVMVRRMKGYRL